MANVRMIKVFCEISRNVRNLTHKKKSYNHGGLNITDTKDDIYCHGNLDEESTWEPRPYTNNSRKVRNAEIRRNSFCQEQIY